MSRRTLATWLIIGLLCLLAFPSQRIVLAAGPSGQRVLPGGTPRGPVGLGTVRGADRAVAGPNAALNRRVAGKYGRHGAQILNQVQRDGVISSQVSTTQSPLISAAAQQKALAAASTVGGPWSALGPNPITFPASAGYSFPTASGRVLSFAYGATSNTLYLGSAGGGVWKSVAGGAWQALTDSMPSLAIGSLAVDSSNNNLVFAGTGEPVNYSPCAGPGNCGPHLYGVGLYKSVDGGTTWSLNGATVFNRQAISAIRIDPTLHSRIFAAVVDEGSNGTRGVAVSTDSGNTWTEPTGPGTLAGFDVNDLVIDNNGNLYAAVQGHGIYYSATHGSTWVSMNGTGLNTLPGTAGDVYKIALAPSTAGSLPVNQVLYTIVSNPTGEDLLGVYRTTDGGINWTQIGDQNSVVSNHQGFYDLYVAVDPGDPSGNTVYIGAVDVARTTNGLGGNPTWSNISNVYGGPCGATAGAIHPDQHAIIFINGTAYFGNDGGVYKTTSATATGPTCSIQILDPGFEDGPPPGETAWTESSGNASELIVSDFRAHSGSYEADLCAYASCNDSISQTFTVPANFTQLTMNYFVQIGTSKTSTAPCSDTFRSLIKNPSGTVISALTINGTNCDASTQWYNPSVDMTTALTPFKGQKVTVVFTGTTDGDTTGTSEFLVDDVTVNAIFGSSASFTALNNSLAISQFYDGALGSGANASTMLLGGLQDNGTVLTSNAGTWNEVHGGDGFFTAIDYNNNLNMYGEYVAGKTYASKDGGVTFTGTQDPSWKIIETDGGTDGSTITPPPSGTESANFSAPLVMDPNTPTTLYSAHCNLWKTTNSEGSWSSIRGTFGTDANGYCKNISAVAVSKSAPNTIYAADYSGNTEVSTNGGTSWTPTDGTSCVPANPSPYWCTPQGAGVTDLAVDPTNSQIVYATVNSFDGAQKLHVFKSTNGGSTWTDISTSLPDIPFQSIAVNPVTPSTIYAGSDNGAYISTNGGTTWSVLGTGLPNVQVYKLVPSADGKQVTAFTFGRGAWRVSISGGSTSVPISIGWNLIDVPLSGTGLTSTSTLLGNMNGAGQLGAGGITVASTYKNGRFNVYVPGYSADQTNLPASQGIFVYSTRSGTWSPSGTAYTSGQPVALQRGWNLVAAPFPSPIINAGAINTEATTCGVKEIATYANSAYSTWVPGQATDVNIPNTSGMWIQCTNAGNWTPL